jgi:hypothetical protein
MGNALLIPSSTLVEVAAADDLLAEEVEAVLGAATVVVNGVAMTGPQLSALFSGHSTEIAALLKTKAQIHDQVLAQHATRDRVRAAALALKAWVVASHGATSPQATTLGFQPANRHPATVATKAEAQVKSKATRAEHQPAPAHAPAAPATTGNGGSNGTSNGH